MFKRFEKLFVCLLAATVVFTGVPVTEVNAAPFREENITIQDCPGFSLNVLDDGMYDIKLAVLFGDGVLDTQYNESNLPEWQNALDDLDRFFVNENVTIANMNYWFAECDGLNEMEFVIPSTVESCSSTFLNCSNLSGVVRVESALNDYEDMFKGAGKAPNSIVIDYAGDCTREMALEMAATNTDGYVCVREPLEDELLTVDNTELCLLYGPCLMSLVRTSNVGSDAGNVPENPEEDVTNPDDIITPDELPENPGVGEEEDVTPEETPEDGEVNEDVSGNPEEDKEVSGNPEDKEDEDVSGNPEETPDDDVSGNPNDGKDEDVSGNPEEGNGDVSGNPEEKPDEDVSGNPEDDETGNTTDKPDDSKDETGDTTDKPDDSKDENISGGVNNKPSEGDNKPSDTTDKNETANDSDKKDETSNEDKVVKPAKAKVAKIKAGKKKVTLKWAAVSGAKGYEVQYSLNKKFKKAKIVKATKANKTIKKLKSNKKYFVRVRAYKVVDGKKVYGSWSSKKSVKIK